MGVLQSRSIPPLQDTLLPSFLLLIFNYYTFVSYTHLRATEFLEVSEIAVPVGLGNDGYPIAVGLQHSSEDGRTEGWVVNVSIS